MNPAVIEYWRQYEDELNLREMAKKKVPYIGGAVRHPLEEAKSPYLEEATETKETKMETKEVVDTSSDKKNPLIGQYVCFTIFASADKKLSERKPKWDEKNMYYLVFQEEKSPKTNHHHYQGYVEFKKKHRLKVIQELLGAPCCHVERRKAKNGLLASQYCKKAETAIPGTLEEYGIIHSVGQGHRTDIDTPAEAIRGGSKLRDVAMEHPTAFVKYSRGFQELEKLARPEIKIPVPKITLRRWQSELLQYISDKKEEDRRKGWWIWSAASSTGKTTTVKYIQATLGVDKVMVGDFRWDDLIYAYDKHDVIVFNIPRGQEMNDTHHAVLEKATDGGIVLSRKYTSCQKLIDAVVVVFANIPPPHKRLPDRFVEINLDESLDGVRIVTQTVPAVAHSE